MSSNGNASSVTYHRPRSWGTCDECGSSLSRATHELPSGDDVCGYCYGVRKGYIGGEQ